MIKLDIKDLWIEINFSNQVGQLDESNLCKKKKESDLLMTELKLSSIGKVVLKKQDLQITDLPLESSYLQ